MKDENNLYSDSVLLKYLPLMILGLLIIFISSKFQTVEIPTNENSEVSRFSYFVLKNFTTPVKFIFLLQVF